MRRRDFIGPVCAAVFSGQASAQPLRHARLGYLSGGIKSDESGAITIDIVRESLLQLGWRTGTNIEIEERWAGGNFASLPRLAGELIAWKPNILVTTGGTETKALQD